MKLTTKQHEMLEQHAILREKIVELNTIYLAQWTDLVAEFGGDFGMTYIAREQHEKEREARLAKKEQP